MGIVPSRWRYSMGPGVAGPGPGVHLTMTRHTLAVAYTDAAVPQLVTLRFAQLHQLSATAYRLAVTDLEGLGDLWIFANGGRYPKGRSRANLPSCLDKRRQLRLELSPDGQRLRLCGGRSWFEREQ